MFSQMLHAGHGSDRIDVMFDVNKADSMKSAERIQRDSTEGIAFSNIMSGHKIKNWRRLLSCTESKNKLLPFCRKAGRNRSFEKSSDESAYLSLLAIGVSSLLKAVGKKSMIFNLHKKWPTHAYLAACQTCCRNHPNITLHHLGHRCFHNLPRIKPICEQQHIHQTWI